MTDTTTDTRYEARGPVRGSCGHRHKSRRAAEACAERDRRACAACGGGVYSDRTAQPVRQ